MDEKEQMVWKAGFISFEKVSKKNFKQLNHFLTFFVSLIAITNLLVISFN